MPGQLIVYPNKIVFRSSNDYSYFHAAKMIEFSGLRKFFRINDFFLFNR